jgi:hypothetical protein
MELNNIEYPEKVINIKDVKAASDVTDKMMSILTGYLDEMDENILVETADEVGIARREKILGITPLDTATLEERRYNVLVKWYDKGVYTEKTLRDSLTKLVGSDMYTLNIDTQNQILTLKISLKTKSMIKAVTDLVESIVPLHIVVNASLLYNNWDMLSTKTWSDLSAHTWQYWREEVLS